MDTSDDEVGVPMVALYVDWEWEFGEGHPPDEHQEVPQEVYESYDPESDVDEVSEWLTDHFDFLVRGWYIDPVNV